MKAVDLEKVRFVFYRLHVVASSENTSPENRQSRKARAFARAVDLARSRHLIGAWVLEDGRQLVWFTHETSHAI